jgi:hypothetical protein
LLGVRIRMVARKMLVVVVWLTPVCPRDVPVVLMRMSRPTGLSGVATEWCSASRLYGVCARHTHVSHSPPCRTHSLTILEATVSSPTIPQGRPLNRTRLGAGTGRCLARPLQPVWTWSSAKRRWIGQCNAEASQILSHRRMWTLM